MGVNLNDMIERITPSADERVREGIVIESVMKRLEMEDADPIIVGSLAKDTDLSGTKDIDIFIQFSKDTSRAKLEREGLRIGKKLFSSFNAIYEIDYAEHPYVKGVIDGFTIEIVPCYKTSKSMSSVDRTPHHTEYVTKRMETMRINPQIRLLKQFMRGAGVYGAEAKVEGFSGYLVELLTIHSGSFERSLETAAAWNDMPIIDLEEYWDSKKALSKVFPEANIIVIDPVDKGRNVAAAVSKRALVRFKIQARQYLECPSETFFFPKPKPIRSKSELEAEIDRRGTLACTIMFKHGKKNANILYAQIRKTSKHIVTRLEEMEFKVFRDDIWTNENDVSAVLLELSTWELPKLVHHTGPPLAMDSEHHKRFLDKYIESKAYVKDGRWVVDIERKHTEVRSAMEEITGERKGFGKVFRKVDDIRILWGKDIFKENVEGWILFLNDYLD